MGTYSNISDYYKKSFRQYINTFSMIRSAEHKQESKKNERNETK